MEYRLNESTIVDMVEEVRQAASGWKLSKKESILLTLSVEEVLLNYLHALGEGTAVDLDCHGLGRHKRVQLRVAGPSLDPFEQEKDVQLLGTLARISDENAPRWRYGRGTNLVTMPATAQKSISNLWSIILALVIGVTLGLIGRLPGLIAVSTAFNESFVMPVANAYTGLLSVMAILLVFFTFPLSITQSDSLNAFSRQTGGLIGGFAGSMAAVMLLTGALSLPVFSVGLGEAGFSGVPSAVLQVLLGFLPSNIITPFAEFDCMKVLIIGLMFGFAFRAMGEKSKGVVSAFDTINLAAVLTNNYLTKFIMVYVGLTAYMMVVTTNIHLWTLIGRILPVMLLFLILIPGSLLLLVCVRLKVSPRVLLKKLLPAFLINCTSASVGASFISFFNELNQDCGVEVNFTTIGCNLGTVLFKPLYAVSLSFMSLMAADSLGWEITLPWLILVLVMSAFLSMSVPNIPGGCAPVMLVLFAQIGFDSAVTESLISINALLQFLIVPVNILSMQLIILLIAGKCEKLDLETLRNEKSA